MTIGKGITGIYGEGEEREEEEGYKKPRRKGPGFLVVFTADIVKIATFKPG
jgi:hypothetical protein